MWDGGGGDARGEFDKADGNGKEVSKYQFSEDVGETTRRLYDHIRSIQNGEVEDKHKMLP